MKQIAPIPTYEHLERNDLNAFMNEGKVNPDEASLPEQLEKILLKKFRNKVSRYLENEKYYDYGKGYVHIENTFHIIDYDWFDSDRSAIFQNCGVNIPTITVHIRYSETISDAVPNPATGYIGISGDHYIHNTANFDLSDPKNHNMEETIDKFLKEIEKAPTPSDMITIMLGTSWPAMKTNYKPVSSRHQGIGRHASIHNITAYEKAYYIEDLNVAFGMTREEFEKMVKSQYNFKKDKLVFDWDQNVMIVNGEFTEVWD